MKTVSRECFSEFEEKKSKFICYVKPVYTKLDAEKFIELINKKHSDATHNVPAYRVIENGREYFKFSDDGEPQNTAGKPIAEIINILDVYNVVVVVTRYFGGIKLGAGGLVRNYAKACKLGLESAEIIELLKKKELMIDFDYVKIDEIDRFILLNGITVIDKGFTERVTYKIEVDEISEQKLRELRGILII